MANLNELIRSSDLIKTAYEFSKKEHGGQKHKNGEPYVNHPIAAAEAVVAWGLDEATVAAALLHDTIEDTRFESCIFDGIVKKRGCYRRLIKSPGHDCLRRRYRMIYIRLAIFMLLAAMLFLGEFVGCFDKVA